MATFPPVEEQLAALLGGTAQTETTDELRKKLERSRATGKPLRVKIGIDPTGFDVHLGHTVPLRKLRQFQELGHTAVLIIGTATAAVGDPSGRDSSRQALTPEQIETNAGTYLTQIAKAQLALEFLPVLDAVLDGLARRRHALVRHEPFFFIRVHASSSPLRDVGFRGVPARNRAA